jgi:hypothetical protein
MKSLLYLLLVLSFVSCGDLEEKDSDGIGRFMLYDSNKTLTGFSGSYLSDICKSLNFKYDEYRGRSSVFESTYTGKLCDDTEISAKNGNNQAYLTINGSKFVSSTGTNTPMFFTDYETRYTGVLAKLCQSVSRSISGVKSQVLDGNLLYHFGFGNLASNCSSGSSSVSCFGFDVGRKDSKGKFVQYKREYVYINNLGASSKLRGIAVKRTLSEACSTEGKTLSLESSFVKVQ